MTGQSSGPLSRARKFFDSDLWWSFKGDPGTVAAAAILLVFGGSTLFAPAIAVHNPFDAAAIDLMDSLLPPLGYAEADSRFILGTDDQGRDMLATILYGARISLFVGFSSVAFAMALGILLGLVSGFVGGRVDAVIMRIADIQLAFPPILIALLVDGIARGLLPRDLHGEISIFVLVFAIGISGWVQYARTVRASTMIEKNKEYVLAAMVIGIGGRLLVTRHILPNVIGPTLVIATIHLAFAIILEATLSFLGVGVPPTTPSLGTLIRIGNEYLFSGEWWITIFPGVALIVLVLSVNLIGDWLRDVFNPKLR